jgi:hypothetical protein
VPARASSRPRRGCGLAPAQPRRCRERSHQRVARPARRPGRRARGDAVPFAGAVGARARGCGAGGPHLRDHQPRGVAREQERRAAPHPGRLRGARGGQRAARRRQRDLLQLHRGYVSQRTNTHVPQPSYTPLTPLSITPQKSARRRATFSSR